MTREEAIKIIRKNWPDSSFTQLREALETLIPELAESEDERIRKFLIDLLSCGIWKEEWPFTPPECVEYLEKQKTSEEAIRYVKENHSPDEVSDFQAAMNMAVAKAYDKGVQDTLKKLKPAEWSEKEKKIIDEAVEYIEKSVEYVQGGFSKWYVSSLARRLDDLKLT